MCGSLQVVLASELLSTKLELWNSSELRLEIFVEVLSVKRQTDLL